VSAVNVLLVHLKEEFYGSFFLWRSATTDHKWVSIAPSLKTLDWEGYHASITLHWNRIDKSIRNKDRNEACQKRSKRELHYVE
jgi:hypothetical protein